jgi:hypothetical protein
MRVSELFIGFGFWFVFSLGLGIFPMDTRDYLRNAMIDWGSFSGQTRKPEEGRRRGTPETHEGFP